MDLKLTALLIMATYILSSFTLNKSESVHPTKMPVAFVLYLLYSCVYSIKGMLCSCNYLIVDRLCKCANFEICNSYIYFVCLFTCRYPSQVFVGDTFCYFAGMTFAVVGIIGHFSKTLILFFMPQIVNFLYSIPQLFKFVPCPRHRLPKYDSKSDLLHISTTEFHVDELNILGRIMVTVFKALKIISWQQLPDGRVITNNFTLINFVMVVFGPVHEKVVTQMLMGVQVCCTVLAFVIRYPMASYFYDS